MSVATEKPSAGAATQSAPPFSSSPSKNHPKQTPPPTKQSSSTTSTTNTPAKPSTTTPSTKPAASTSSKATFKSTAKMDPENAALLSALWDEQTRDPTSDQTTSQLSAQVAVPDPDPALFLDMFGTTAPFATTPGLSPGLSSLSPDVLSSQPQLPNGEALYIQTAPLLPTSATASSSVPLLPQITPIMSQQLQQQISQQIQQQSQLMQTSQMQNGQLQTSQIQAAKQKPRKLTSEEMDNSNPSITSDGKPRKHIRRACLECRKRHIRCDGVMPICKKCQENNRECSYVPSNRGGLRIPKNKQLKLQEQLQDKDKPQWAFASPCMMDSVLAKSMTARAAPGNKSQEVPIPVDQDKRQLEPEETDTLFYSPPSNSSSPNSTSLSASSSQSPPQPLVLRFSPEPERSPAKKKSISEDNKMNEVINGVFALSPYAERSNSICNRMSSLDHSPELSSSTPSTSPQKDLSSGTSPNFPTPLGSESSEQSMDDTLDLYYALFHQKNPILPSRDRIKGYLASIDKPTELIMAIKLIVYISTNPASPRLSDLEPRIKSVYSTLEEAPDDVVKLQASILLLLAAHLNTDNTTSLSLRNWLFYFLFHKLSSYNLMAPVSDFNNSGASVPVDIFLSPRLAQTDRKTLKESVARLVHEAFFLEILFSLIGRTPLTRFALSGVVETIPISNITGFAYNSRYKTAKVVRTILCSLTTVGSGICFSTEFGRIQSLISTFRLFLSGNGQNKNSQFPPLVDPVCGLVDDGIHQASMILNFAAVILNFPFSNLMQSNKLPSYVDCTESSGPIMGPGALKRSKHEAQTSTDRCIEAANSIVNVIPVIGMSHIMDRSPTFSCSLSMAMLVHMKAYHWCTKGSGAGEQGTCGEENIQKLMEAVKLESSTLKRFSRNWILPGKLNTSLCNVMFNVLPELYEYTVETTIHPKRKAEEEQAKPMIERNCWMNKLNIPDFEGINEMENKPNMELGLDIFDQLFDFEATSNNSGTSVSSSEAPRPAIAGAVSSKIEA